MPLFWPRRVHRGHAVDGRGPGEAVVALHGGWHALRFSEGRVTLEISPRPSEYLRACHPKSSIVEPCLFSGLDVFIAVTRLMGGDPAKPWWHYTAGGTP